MAARRSNETEKLHGVLRRCHWSCVQCIVAGHGRKRREERERRASVGGQHPARHAAGGIRNLRRAAGQISVRDARWRGRPAAALDQPRALPGAGRASRARDRPAAGARRERRRTAVSAQCRRRLVVQGQGRRQAGALRRSWLAARLRARRDQLVFRVPGR